MKKAPPLPFEKAERYATATFLRPCFFSHSIKLFASSNYFAALLAKMPAFNSHLWKNAHYRNLKLTSEDLLPCYCYAIKSNSRTILSQVSQSASAGK